MVGATTYQPRIIDGVLEQRLQHHPAILLVGPRATGKTTTAARLANSTVRLDKPGEAAVAEGNPDSVLRGLPEPVLIDEWQIAPNVLGAVKRAVDADPRPGRFIVTGSVRGDLDSPTWPGTGRLLRIAMYGMTVAELHGRIPPEPLLDRLVGEGVDAVLGIPPEGLDLRDYAELAATGGFPQPALRLPAQERAPWWESYVDQLLTRDLADLGTNRDPLLMRRYLEAYALNTAGITDHRAVYEAAGVARATGEAYERLLQNLFVAESLPAWWSNRLKRLVKGPKRYLVDPAMALALLRIDVNGLMRDSDLMGRILDTLVVAQLRAQIAACTTQPRLYHLRQEKGEHDVDILVEYGGGRVIGIEIKATSAPRLDDARHLTWLRDELGDRFLGGVVLSTGPRPFMLDDRIVAAPISTVWS